MSQLDVIRAAHRRLRDPGGEDTGFVLIYVLMIITIVTVLVGSVLVVSASSVVPSVQSAYAQAASAAAQAGIEDLKARADSLCTGTNSTVTNCVGQLPSAMQNSWIAINQPTAGYTAQYKWSYAATTSGLLRVTSTGQVTQGGISVSRTLVADLAGGAATSCFDYSGCTQYETQSPDVMAQLFPNRTISLSAGALANADAAPGASGSSVTWNGPGAPASTTNAGAVNSCNDRYYNPATGTGRETHGPSGATTPFVDWSETGSIGTTAVTDYQPCQVSFGSSSKLLAPTNTANGVGGYATNDAALFSNSNPGSTGGPLLNEPVFTTYAGASDPSGVAGQNYRSFTLPGYSLAVGGSPAAGSSYPSPQTVTSVPGAITAAPSVPANSCVYQGPTRVYFNSDGSATVTSPQTTTALAGSPSWCYPAGLSGGIYFYKTPVLSTVTGFSGVFSVRNDGTPANPTVHTSTGWNTTGQKSTQTASAANTVFYQSAGAASSGDASTTGAASTCSATSTYTGTNASSACQWSDASSTTAGSGWVADGTGWTKYSAGTTCGNDSTDRLTFECDYNRGSVGTSHDYYGIVRNSINNTLTNNSISCGGQSFAPLTATSAQLACVLQGPTGVGVADSTANTINAAGAKVGDHQYIATQTGTPATSSGTKNVGAAPSLSAGGDPLFDSSKAAGSVSTESANTTTTTFTVGRQIYGCYVPQNASIVGTLQTILAGLGLAATPGSYDPTNKLCGQVCLLVLCSAGPGIYTWGDGIAGTSTSVGNSVAQFQVKITQAAYSGFQQGNSAVLNFPFMSDVTQYATGSGGATGSNGPGDLYVEGTPSTSVALVAANDVIVTGSLGPAASSGAGVEVAAQDNVRVYHPVSCLAGTAAASINATTAGFCPNDLTGLYKTIPPSGYRPYQQYTNLRADLSGMSVNAAVFALGQANAGSLCPKWSSGGQCGGEFTVDNYNRGAALAALAVTGTVYQIHHGALGEEWEVPDTSGQTRPTSGYTLTLQYQNLKSPLGNFGSLLQSAATIASLWHTVSVSTVGAS